jgi:outer membrane protein assembly factor BamD (BamD/ComL family)
MTSPKLMRHPVLNRLAAAAALSLALVAGAQAQDAVRPDVGKPLQQANELIRAQRFKEALAKVHDADAVPNKTANESYMIERMRLAAASGAGDVETAAKSFEAVSARVNAADRLRMIESLAGAYYRAKDYAKAMQWGQRYFKEGGTSGAIRTLLIQSQYLAGDFAGAARELTTEIQQAEKSGSAPGEDRLKLLVNATLKLNDTNGYVWALERLVTHYPKKEYWVDLLARLQRKPNFSDRLALDTYRLSLATDTLSKPGDYMEMAQLALQAGYPGEARQVVDKGFAANVLGQGAEAERHKRLRDLVAKRVEEDKGNQAAALEEAQAAKDGTALVNVGMKLVFNGDKQKGLQLMQQGIAKGNLKRADDARLHLAIAQLVAGENAKAQTTLKGVTGNDGTADLARLWSLYAKRK